jgi:hypothetical protein
MLKGNVKQNAKISFLSINVIPTSMFEIVVAVAVQSIFGLDMHQNKVLSIF